MSGRFLVYSFLVFGASTLGAKAEMWANFYSSSTPAEAAIYEPVSDRADFDSICLSEILDAQYRYEIPQNLLLAIGIQEAGRKGERGLTVWPWSVNAGGQGLFFPDRDAMLVWLRDFLATGKTNVDVGCMQINKRWHGDAFDNLEQSVDPRANVDYAARFLVDLYEQEGDWMRAAGRYHSATPKYQEIYLAKLDQNLKLANAGFDALPSRSLTSSADSFDQFAPPPPAFNWTSELSGKLMEALEGEHYSIYSNYPLQSILPDYREAN